MRFLPLAALIAVIPIALLVLTRHSPPATKDAHHPPAVTSSTVPSSSSTVPSSSTTVPSSTTTSTTTPPTTTVPTPTVPVSNVLVQVVNGTGAPNAGFAINGTGDAASLTYTTNVIEYPPGGLADADTLLAHISGPTRLEEDSSIPTHEVYFIVGSSYTGVVK